MCTRFDWPHVNRICGDTCMDIMEFSISLMCLVIVKGLEPATILARGSDDANSTLYWREAEAQISMQALDWPNMDCVPNSGQSKSVKSRTHDG